MRKLARSLVALGLSAALAGCLGTVVEAPTGSGATYGSTRGHLIGSSTAINAADCTSGLQEVVVFVPLWGVAVGILTFGILVPMSTSFTCAK